ncbi:MAG: thiamine phosphate synthase [bacterium]
MKQADARIYRVIDANLNRAVEGIRVIEDLARFASGDGALSAELRRLRHLLRAAPASLPGGKNALLSARDSVSDPGRTTLPSAKKKPSDLLTANFNRVQEALRVLEETANCLSPSCSKKFAAARFTLYDLEKKTVLAVSTGGAHRPSLPDPPFICVIGAVEDLDSDRRVESLIRGGAALLQLREKNATDRRVLNCAKRLSAAARKLGALAFVNDRLDIALAAGAHGVHLGAGDVPLRNARKISGGKLLFGVSTHSLTQALAAAKAAPDYISLGPIFPSPTKPGKKPLGVRALADVCGAVPVPVVAIGGVNDANVEDVFCAGAAGAAIISAVKRAENPRAFLEKTLRRAEKTARRTPL